MILFRYIAITVIQSIFIVFLVVAGIQYFIGFAGEVNNIGIFQYSGLMVLFCLLLKLPFELYQMFPLIGFLGCLLGLGRLSSQHELVIIQAAGVSVARITGMVVIAATGLMLMVAGIGEGVAPQMHQYADQLKNQSLHKTTTQDAIYHDVWLHQGQSFLYLQQVVPNQKAMGVTRFDLDANYHLIGMLVADEVVYQQGQWWAKAATVYSIQADKVHKDTHRVALGMEIKPELIHHADKNLFSMSTLSLLWYKIQYKRAMGLQASQDIFLFWQRIFQPLTSIVMICLGVPFIFGSLRQSTVGFRIMVGVFVGFGFYMLNQFIGPIAMIYQVQPIVAALFPTLLFFCIFLYFVKKQ